MMELEAVESEGCWHGLNRRVGYTLPHRWRQEGRAGMVSVRRKFLPLFEAVGLSPESENPQEGLIPALLVPNRVSYLGREQGAGKAEKHTRIWPGSIAEGILYAYE